MNAHAVLLVALAVSGLSTSLARTPGATVSAPAKAAAVTVNPAVAAGAKPACAKLPKPGSPVSLTTFELKSGPQAHTTFANALSTWTKANPNTRAAFCWAKTAASSTITCLSMWKDTIPKEEPLVAALGPALASTKAVSHDIVGNEHIVVFSAGGAKDSAECSKLLEGIPAQGSAISVFGIHMKPEKWAAGSEYFYKKFLPDVYKVNPRRAMIYWADKDTVSVRGISIWQDAAAAKAWTDSPVRKVHLDALAPFTRSPIEVDYAVLVAHSVLSE